MQTKALTLKTAASHGYTQIKTDKTLCSAVLAAHPAEMGDSPT